MRNLCDRLLGLCLQWDRFGAGIKAGTVFLLTVNVVLALELWLPNLG